MIGPSSQGTTDMFVRCIEVTIASEPGYLDHELVVQQIDGGGGDWVSICADGKTVKLDVRTVGVTKDGAFFSTEFLGILKISPEVQAHLDRVVGCKETAFGASHIVPKFKSGDPRYKHLQDEIFIGAGRFCEAGEVVEYKISQCITP